MNSPEKDVFSILYLNTRSLNKNFESLKTLLAKFGFWIQIICILNAETTESWCSADTVIKNIYWLLGYSSEHQFRSLGQGVAEWIWIFLHDYLIFKLPPDLSISNEEMEAFSIEIICKNLKNILIGTQYSHTASKGKIFEKYLKKYFNKTKTRNNQSKLSSTWI